MEEKKKKWAKVVVKPPSVFYGGGTASEVSTNGKVVVLPRRYWTEIKQWIEKQREWINDENLPDSSTAHISSRETQHSPQFATFLLCLFLSADDRDTIIGDLDERFPKWVEYHGARIARLLYLKDACTAIYPAALKFLAKIAKISVIEEFIRRIRFW